MSTDVLAEHAEELQYATACSDMFGILASTLDYQSLEQVFNGLAGGTLRADVLAIAAELGLDDALIGDVELKLEICEQDIKAGVCTFADIRCEYTRLFNHPDYPAIAFYEGAFIKRQELAQGKLETDKDVLFINRAALDAGRQYKRAGVKRVKEKNIPEDCMSTEMEFMQYLFAQQAEAILTDDTVRKSDANEWIEEFSKIHLNKWMADFFDECSTLSTTGFYQAVGLLGRLFALGLE